jgi:secreted trypsin-like serine protease
MENLGVSECNCGKLKGSPKDGSRIVGGKLAKANDYPWQAKIVDVHKEHLCGGTIISRSRFVYF